MSSDEKKSPIYLTITSVEAGKMWGRATDTIKKRCQEGRFPVGMYRRASRDWLIDYNALVQAYGEPIKTLDEIME